MSIENVEAIYSELLGYLSQAPETTDYNQLSGEAESMVWNQLNIVIDILGEKLDTDLSRFKIKTFTGDMVGLYVSLFSYRQKLGGLIAFLHRQYFKHEPPPFPNMPVTTVINQTQSQQIDIQFMLDLSGTIETALPKTKEGSPERRFLTKLKDTIGTANTGMDMLGKVLKSAKDHELTIATVMDLLSKIKLGG